MYNSIPVIRCLSWAAAARDSGAGGLVTQPPPQVKVFPVSLNSIPSQQHFLDTARDVTPVVKTIASQSENDHKVFSFVETVVSSSASPIRIRAQAQSQLWLCPELHHVRFGQ